MFYKKLLCLILLTLFTKAEDFLEVKTSLGSGSYVEEVYINKIKINLPDLDDEAYMGHDTFRLEGKTLIREYPIYKNGDPNCCPSGGTKTIKYENIIK